MELSARMMADTLKRAHDPARATDEGSPQQGVCAVLSAERLAALETRLGRPFPAFLQHLYREVGDGGFGPGYGLLSAADAVGRALAWNADSASQTQPGLLPVAYWGCTVYSVTDLNTGRVGLIDLDALDDGLTHSQVIWWHHGTLEPWWQAWLDGENLFYPVEES